MEQALRSLAPRTFEALIDAAKTAFESLSPEDCLGLVSRDMVATATALTAWSIAEAYKRFVMPSVAPSASPFRVI